MRVVVDYDVDRLQVYNGDIKPSSTNCPRSFSQKDFAFRDYVAELLTVFVLQSQFELRSLYCFYFNRQPLMGVEFRSLSVYPFMRGLDS